MPIVDLKWYASGYPSTPRTTW